VSDEEPLVFNLIFTVAQRDTAFSRNPAGGARMWIEIDRATVPDANRMIDLMEVNDGTVFAAAVVVVKQEFEEFLSNGRKTWSKVNTGAAPSPTRMAGRRVQRPTD